MPETNQYTIETQFDNGGTLTFDDGDTVDATFSNQGTLVKTFVAGEYYPFDVKWYTSHYGATCALRWETSTL